MSESQLAWTQVWKTSQAAGEYSFVRGRLERALDKLDHFNLIGVKFNCGEKVLEAGCGDGAVIISLQKAYGVKGYGADFAKTAEDQAEQLMRKECCPFSFINSDIRQLPYADNFFDKVVCLGVVEHMVDPLPAIKELFRVLKPDGVAIIMTPNSLSAGRLDRILKQQFGVWHMGYQDEFSTKKLAGFVKAAGFQSVDRLAVHRPNLPNDTWSRKLVSHVDKVLRRIINGWGFYSYTWARKR